MTNELLDDLVRAFRIEHRNLVGGHIGRAVGSELWNEIRVKLSRYDTVVLSSLAAACTNEMIRTLHGDNWRETLAASWGGADLIWFLATTAFWSTLVPGRSSVASWKPVNKPAFPG